MFFLSAHASQLVFACVQTMSRHCTGRDGTEAVARPSASYLTAQPTTMNACAAVTSPGRLVVELFEDLAPAAARHLMNRCAGMHADMHVASDMHVAC
jgi:hypothetical protein